MADTIGATPIPMFRCQNCSHTQAKWAGKCPTCDAWNRMEEVADAPKAANAGKPGKTAGTALAVSVIETGSFESARRIPLASAELSGLLS